MFFLFVNLKTLQKLVFHFVNKPAGRTECAGVIRPWAWVLLNTVKCINMPAQAPDFYYRQDITTIPMSYFSWFLYALCWTETKTLLLPSKVFISFLHIGLRGTSRFLPKKITCHQFCGSVKGNKKNTMLFWTFFFSFSHVGLLGSCRLLPKKSSHNIYVGSVQGRKQNIFVVLNAFLLISSRWFVGYLSFLPK